MLESQINLTDVADALELVKDSDSPNNGTDNVILELGKYFAQIRKPEVLYDMWTRDKLSWTKFVRSKNEDEIKDFLVPKVSELLRLLRLLEMYSNSISVLCRTCIIFVMKRH